MDQRGDPHRRHPGHQNDDTCNRSACDGPRDGNGHHEDRPDLFCFLRNLDQLGTFGQRLIPLVVLNGMPDLMGSDRNRRQGFAIEDRRCQADRFGDRIIVIADLRRFHDDVVEVESIEQVPG